MQDFENLANFITKFTEEKKLQKETKNVEAQSNLGISEWGAEMVFSNGQAQSELLLFLKHKTILKKYCFSSYQFATLNLVAMVNSLCWQHTSLEIRGWRPLGCLAVNHCPRLRQLNSQLVSLHYLLLGSNECSSQPLLQFIFCERISRNQLINSFWKYSGKRYHWSQWESPQKSVLGQSVYHSYGTIWVT